MRHLAILCAGLVLAQIAQAVPPLGCFQFEDGRRWCVDGIKKPVEKTTIENDAFIDRNEQPRKQPEAAGAGVRPIPVADLLPWYGNRVIR